MTLLTNTRSSWALGLAVLLVVAAVAPLCAMSSDMAMAMPMPADQTPGAPGECDTQGSMASCPSASNVRVPSSTTRTDVDQPVIADVPQVVAPLEPGQSVSDLRTPVQASPPPGQMTPLRL